MKTTKAISARGETIRVGDLVRPLIGGVPSDMTLEIVTDIMFVRPGKVIMNVESRPGGSECASVDPARYVLDGR